MYKEKLSTISTRIANFHPIHPLFRRAMLSTLAWTEQALLDFSRLSDEAVAKRVILPRRVDVQGLEPALARHLQGKYTTVRRQELALWDPLSKTTQAKLLQRYRKEKAFLIWAMTYWSLTANQRQLLIEELERHLRSYERAISIETGHLFVKTPVCSPDCFELRCQCISRSDSMLDTWMSETVFVANGPKKVGSTTSWLISQQQRTHYLVRRAIECGVLEDKTDAAWPPKRHRYECRKALLNFMEEHFQPLVWFVEYTTTHRPHDRFSFPAIQDYVETKHISLITCNYPLWEPLRPAFESEPF